MRRAAKLGRYIGPPAVGVFISSTWHHDAPYWVCVMALSLTVGWIVVAWRLP